MNLYSPTDTHAASDKWGANCGPSAIAAAFGLDVAAVRKAVSGKRGTFAGYMGIPDVQRACSTLGRAIKRAVSRPGPIVGWPHEGTHLAMVAVDGPWRDNKFEAARRRHLVAAQWSSASGIWRVYDVNAGSWLPSLAWSRLVMDPLASDQRVYPETTGRWDFTWRGTLAAEVSDS